MTASFDRHTFPNGGWEFYQPQTNWWAPYPKSNTFDQQVVNIIKHRQANPAVTINHRLATDFASVGNELEAYTRARLNIPAIAPQPPNPPPPQQPSAVAVAAGSTGIIRVAQGSGPILEWFGSGRPAVDRPISEKRASTCSSCPQNTANNPADQTALQWFVEQAGKVIAKGLEARQDLKLETSLDARLGVCKACLCPMKTKVHCPLDIILNHLKPEVRADLDPRCWILHNDQ